jgi:hypothetical protein
MDLKKAVFDFCFAVFGLVFALHAALQCFWPAKLKALRDRFPRGYNTESPLGRMMERAHDRESGLANRINGFILLVMILGMLAWWFLRELS